MQMAKVTNSTLFSSSSWGRTLSYVQHKDVFIFCYYSANIAFFLTIALRGSRKERRQTTQQKKWERLGFQELLSSGQVVIILVAQLASVVRKAVPSPRQGHINLTQLIPRISWSFHKVQQIFAIAALPNRQIEAPQGQKTLFSIHFLMERFSKWTLKGTKEGQYQNTRIFWTWSATSAPALFAIEGQLQFKVFEWDTILARMAVNTVQSQWFGPQSFTKREKEAIGRHTFNYRRSIIIFSSLVLQRTLRDCRVLSMDRRLRQQTKKWLLYIKS